jgi:hypothetical protein
MPEGLDEAREAFAQEIPQATRQRDQSGRFVSTNRPEPIFQPRDVEGDERGDTSDGGADPRFVEQERRVADGRSEEGNEQSVSRPAKRVSASANDNDEPADAQPPERIGQETDDANKDVQKPDGGDGSEPGDEDTSPRYKIQVDGEEREVSLNEALRGYQREETFNSRMRQMVEVAKAIDQRGAEAQAARDGYIQLCHRQEQEFAALIPPEPKDWEQLYRDNPQAAHQLELNYRAVYGTLNAIRQRRAMAQQEAANDNAQRTAAYARAEWDKFCHKNKLANQTEIDHALKGMRATAASHNFTEDEISTTYDERMLSVLYKASKYDKMVANKPFPVQPERQGALQPGSAPRIGNGAARSMNDAQRRLAATGRVDDAALVMAQFLRPQR